MMKQVHPLHLCRNRSHPSKHFTLLVHHPIHPASNPLLLFLPLLPRSNMISIIPLLHVPPTFRATLSMPSLHARNRTTAIGMRLIQSLGSAVHLKPLNMRLHARRAVNMDTQLLGVTCWRWRYGCFGISRISLMLEQCRPWNRDGLIGTRSSCPVMIVHHALSWLTIARRWSSPKIRWTLNWIGISSLQQQMRCKSMNDYYGKLVSRFPHHSLTMALLLLFLTHFPCHHEFNLPV